MNLKHDEHFRYWYIDNYTKPLLKCKTWSYEIADYGDSEELKGMNLYASLDFLKELCRVEQKDLIIEVQIRRSIRESKFSTSSDYTGYTPPKHKIFVLSMEGDFKDERGSIESGQIISR